MRGNCYVASEALYHLMGGKSCGWTPMQMQHEGDSHWFLKNSDGTIIDATVRQFSTMPDYSKARGRGFLTKNPSKRACEMMENILWGERKKKSGAPF